MFPCAKDTKKLMTITEDHCGTIALANEMARMVWAMLARNEDYRHPAGTVC